MSRRAVSVFCNRAARAFLSRKVNNLMPGLKSEGVPVNLSVHDANTSYPRAYTEIGDDSRSPAGARDCFSKSNQRGIVFNKHGRSEHPLQFDLQGFACPIGQMRPADQLCFFPLERSRDAGASRCNARLPRDFPHTLCNVLHADIKSDGRRKETWFSKRLSVARERELGLTSTDVQDKIHILRDFPVPSHFFFELVQQGRLHRFVAIPFCESNRGGVC